MPSKTITRRAFIRTSVVIAGAAGALTTGLTTGCAPAQRPAGQPVVTPAFTFGDPHMETRTLVAYATRTGSTVGVAEALGQSLAARGFAVDVKPMQENPDLSGYQHIILGSAINGGQWLPEAVQYVKDHQQALGQVPVALFCVHIMNLGADEQSRARRLAYLDAVRAHIQPAGEAYFAGIGMNPAETGGLIRWVYRTFKIGPEGDCRDWQAIRAWGEAVFA